MIDLDKFVSEALAPQKEVFPPIGDFHTANAIAFYGYDTVYNAYKNDYKHFKEVLRDNAKKTGLALLYGGSYKTIMNGIGVSEAEAKQMHTRFFATLSGFSKHIKILEKQATKTGKIKNLFGTYLHLPEMQSDDWREKAAGLRHLQNYPIQSIAANLIQLIIVQVHKLIEDCDTNIFAGDNIHEKYYNRVFTTTQDTDFSKLKETLETLPDGNIMILHKEKAYNRYVGLPSDLIEQYHLVDLLDTDLNNCSEAIQDILCDLQQNILAMFHTIHDEIDFIVDSNLHKGIAKRVAEIGAVKNVFDKIGVPYINYLYDVEPNSDGSFIPNKNDVVILKDVPSCESEFLAMQETKESEPEIETITLELDSIKEIKQVIKYSVKGIRLVIDTPSKQHIVPKLVELYSIKDFMQYRKQ